MHKMKNESQKRLKDLFPLWTLSDMSWQKMAPVIEISQNYKYLWYNNTNVNILQNPVSQLNGIGATSIYYSTYQC